MKRRTILVLVVVASVIVAGCAFGASRVPLLTGAFVYHLRYGDAVRLRDYKFRLPAKFFPIHEDDRSVILSSGDSAGEGTNRDHSGKTSGVRLRKLSRHPYAYREHSWVRH
jgi:hypothetical protein